MSFKKKDAFSEKHCKLCLNQTAIQISEGKKFMSSVATVLLSAQHGQSDLSLALGGTVNQLLLSVTQEVRDEIYMHH